jgi:hypothetical protein
LVLEKKSNLKFLLICLYFALTVLFICMTGFALRLSQLIPFLLPLTLLDGQPKKFIKQWAPFYLLILLYDCFRGMADDLASRVEYMRLIHWEKCLFFGNIPTIWLQQKFHSQLAGPLGYALAAFYFGHFLLPIAFLYWTWRKNQRAFLCFMSCLCVLSLAGFITFFLFPAAPPWLASAQGYLPPVQKMILSHIANLSGHLPNIYISMNANPVAAFPSLHAAYPLLWFLCGWKYFSKKAAILLLVNVLGVAFAIVSFGEHYVIDVWAGWFYALAAFYVTEKVALPAILNRGFSQIFTEKCLPKSV